MTTGLDPYAVLGVSADAPADGVAAAYRRLARRYHPDVSQEADAEPRMAEINAAWNMLRDPERRAAWNRAHGLPVARPSAPRAAPRPAVPHPALPATGAVRSDWTPAGAAAASGWRRGPDGEGAAGPPPGNPRGSVLSFGRHWGWSLGEIARVDPGYLTWLADRREGAPYRDEIVRLLAAMYPAGTVHEPAPRPRGGRLFG